MGAYGNKEIETPTFDALAREGTLFQQAVSVAPLTLPVHSSMFTGKFPPEHGVRDNGGFFLGPEQLTLAEVLKAKGYRTGGFIAAYVLDGKWGINQGFDTYYDKFDLSESRSISLAAIRRPGNEVLDQALPWIEGAKEVPSSRGCISTTRTRRTARPSPLPRSTRSIPTTAASPLPIRRWRG